jgi:3-dehydroquinate synthase
MIRQIDVNASNGNYSIVVGSGIHDRAAAAIRDVTKDSKSFVVVDANLPTVVTDTFFSAFEDAGVRFESMLFSASEKNKTLESYERICRWLLDRRAERTSGVIALGGGITGDFTGFVAATYQRGVPFFQIPTTLLAMVDASVGGKVAVNLASNKNMLGAFYQPRAVFADVDSLKQLELRQIRCGLAECIKHGIIGDVSLFDWTSTHMDRFLDREADDLVELVGRNVAFKAAIVDEDATERGVRALLNLGHTFGHAIEALDVSKTLYHGEAVSIGVVAACYLGQSKGLCDEEVLLKAEAAFVRAGLPVRLNLNLTPKDLVDEMKRDKKSAFSKLRVIVPTSIGRAIVYDDATESDLATALEYVIA